MREVVAGSQRFYRSGELRELPQTVSRTQGKASGLAGLARPRPVRFAFLAVAIPHPSVALLMTKLRTEWKPAGYPLGVDPGTLAQWESGLKEPSTHLRRRIEAALRGQSSR